MSWDKCLIPAIFMMCLLAKARGQQLYFKPCVRYDQSVATQISPQYFSLEILVPGGTNYSSGIAVSSGIKNFSLAGGFKYGATFGYQFNDILGAEAGIDYFKTDKTVQSDPLNFYVIGITHWDFQSIQVSPSFTFRKSKKKSSLTGKIGVTIGVAWLENSIYVQDNYLKTYQFGNNISLGYTFGLEYNYHFKTNLSLVAEAGLEHSSYTPQKATLTAIKGFNGNSVQDQNTYTKQIVYVDQIRNLPVNVNYYSNSYASDQNKPEVRIKEALRFTSIYFGIGVKYNFSRK